MKKILLIVILLPLHILSHADGFGWYGAMYDYDQLNKYYENGRLLEYVSDIDKRGDDWGIIDFIYPFDERDNQKDLYFESLAYEYELIWHEALEYFIKEAPFNSVLKELPKGRVFNFNGAHKQCEYEELYYRLIRGSCYSAFIFTNTEVKEVFWTLQNMDRVMSDDIEYYYKNLLNLFKEAALLNKGVAFYGHD